MRTNTHCSWRVNGVVMDLLYAHWFVKLLLGLSVNMTHYPELQEEEALPHKSVWDLVFCLNFIGIRIKSEVIDSPPIASSESVWSPHNNHCCQARESKVSF